MKMFDNFIINLLVLSLLSFNIITIESVNLAVQDKLTKEELLALDREVTDFYNDDYHSMSMKNVSHDDELYRSIKAFRHTVVLHQFDYFYSNQDIAKRSIGSKVDQDLCKIQLSSIVKISEQPKLSIQLEAINFLETYGRVQPGYLNGDTYWRGSVSSCDRARINSNYWQNYLTTNEKEIINNKPFDGHKNNNIDIVGRYCIAHMKSKNWPTHNKYFENRLSIKVGICIPESCHTITYLNSTGIKESVDRLARYQLIEPFNGNSYYVDYLYCFPDEDSPFRQWDLGTKLFVCFGIIWISLLIYTNIKYNQRLKTVKRLRNTVDIRMIINQRKYTTSCDEDTDDEDTDDYDVEFTSNNNNNNQHQLATQQQVPTISHTSESRKSIDESESSNYKNDSSDAQHKTTSCQQLNSNEAQAESASYLLTNAANKSQHQSLLPGHLDSRSVSPIPSDIEENDGEFNVIRPIVCPKKTNKRQSIQEKNLPNASTSLVGKQQLQQQQQSKGFDLIKAFSIMSNLDYLFKTRTNEKQTKESNFKKQEEQQQEVNLTLNAMKRLSQQHLNSIHKRASSSNEALIKDLTKQRDRGSINDPAKSKVAIVAQGATSHHHGTGASFKEQGNNQERSSSSNDNNSDNNKNINLFKTTTPTLITKQRKRVDVDIFDGIKVFATSYIVFGHTMMFFFGIVTDLRFGNERMFDFTMIAIINALQVVGLFYIITGALVTYLSFSKQKTKHLLQPTFWILVLIGRYIRLIPTYILVFWFARHVAPFTGSGAFWNDYRTDYEHVRGYCSQQDWRSVIFMSAADVKIPFDCVPQAWYLSNDFRTLFVLPFYVMLLVFNTIAGYCAIFGTILYSTFSLMVVLKEANIDYGVLLLWQPHVYSLLTDRLHSVYTRLDIRLSTYLLGVVVGHLLYLYEQKRIKQWPKLIKSYGLKYALVSICLLFMGAVIIANPHVNQFLPKSNEIHSDTLLILIPFFKIYMEFCICIALLLLVTGSGYKWILKLLSSKISKVFSQISYGVFLIHVELMFKMPMNKIESDYWYLFLNGTYFVVLSNAIAFLIYVLYEMPINNIMRQFFKKLFGMFVK